MMKMMKKVNVLFNTNKFYIDSFLPEIKGKIDNPLFSSSDLLVYENNDLEIMINNLGTVSITTVDGFIDNVKDLIPTILEEYNKLTLISDRFEPANTFKVISPKQMSSKVIEQLVSLNYITELSETFDTHTLRVH
jgi:hypothetical protein